MVKNGKDKLAGKVANKEATRIANEQKNTELYVTQETPTDWSHKRGV